MAITKGCCRNDVGAPYTYDNLRHALQCSFKKAHLFKEGNCFKTILFLGARDLTRVSLVALKYQMYILLATSIFFRLFVFFLLILGFKGLIASTLSPFFSICSLFDFAFFNTSFPFSVCKVKHTSM